jgi:hypothetical protein
MSKLSKFKFLPIAGLVSLVGLPFSSANAQIDREDLDIVFRYVMGRSADDGDYAFWQSNTDVTVPIQVIPDSEEYRTAIKPYVVDMYLTLLGRYPDLQGARDWQSAGPFEMYRSIKASQEAKQIERVNPERLVQYSNQPCVTSNVVLKTPDELDILFSSSTPGYGESQQILQNNYIYVMCGGKTDQQSVLEIVEIKNTPAAVDVFYTLRPASSSESGGNYPSATFTTERFNKNISFKFIRHDFVDGRQEFMQS